MDEVGEIVVGLKNSQGQVQDVQIKNIENQALQDEFRALYAALGGKVLGKVVKIVG